MRVPEPGRSLIAIFTKESAKIAIVLKAEIISYLHDSFVRVGE
jgi:hypothetical protein